MSLLPCPGLGFVEQTCQETVLSGFEDHFLWSIGLGLTTP